MSGILIPMILPVNIPLWMLALAVAFAVIFAKEIFGGTGMNILNVALVARAFLFFSYPTKMTGGGDVWIANETILGLGNNTPDVITQATPLGQIAQDQLPTATMMDSAKNPQKIEELRKYVLGNWSAVRRTLRNKLVNGCSAESHVSHVLSDRLSSRPMAWSETGADRMSKLRCYDRNNGRTAIIDLVKYSRNQRHLEATGTDGIEVHSLQLRNVLAEHYNQANSYIDRMQAHIPYGTVRKTLAIREKLNLL